VKRRTQVAVTAAGVLALAGIGTGVVSATGVADDDASEQPITSAARDQAEQAAIAEVGEGEVTGTEVDDEESKYEVEVTRDDGSEVDVQLDENFEVVSTEDEGSDDEAGDDG